MNIENKTDSVSLNFRKAAGQGQARQQQAAITGYWGGLWRLDQKKQHISWPFWGLTLALGVSLWLLLLEAAQTLSL